MLDVSLLGTGGMMPMPKRFLSSMIMRLNGRLIVVDCGEGTQVSLKNLGWGFKAIDAIMFTHFHADHISGLPGMLLAIGNAGRTEPLKLVGPKGLIYVVEGLRRIAQDIHFEIEYIEVDEKNQQDIEINGFTVRTLFVEHSVKCIAYKVEVCRKGRFDVKKAQALGLPKKEWSALQKDMAVEHNGNTYTADMVLGESRRGIILCFCTDSRPVDELIDFIKDCDLFICEGMYGENEKLNKAIENRHMLFSEAARLAKAGNVKKMWLTHYSPALSEPEEFLDNAKSIFENTILGFDGITETILFEN